MNNTHKGHIIFVMNNTQIRLFVKIAESGSFTKAGVELNMTQPAVSRATSSLETELDVKLLLRDRRNGLILTDIGKRILVIFREILMGFDKVNQEIYAERGLEKGSIRIGAFPVASAYFLPKIISSITGDIRISRSACRRALSPKSESGWNPKKLMLAYRSLPARSFKPSHYIEKSCTP